MNNSKAAILVVDDAPDALALLHDNLVETGYDVLVATNGESALNICNQINIDLVLLDAIMPGMNGFEVCSRLKQGINTRHIPVIFMTGLTESEHVVAGFNAGGIDYVTKPLNSKEVLARVEAHIGNARMMTQTQKALDTFGQAAIALLPNTTKVIWQTPFSKQLLANYFDKHSLTGEFDLSVLGTWISALAKSEKNRLQDFNYVNEYGRLVFSAADISSEEQWLILIHEESETAQLEALQLTFNLTKRESEVLYWASLGKTDKLIGEILGTSSRTVNKHMQHVFVKLDVETRTAAATLAISKLHSART